jgi:ubiquitin-like-conjugating enzyme ATG3
MQALFHSARNYLTPTLKSTQFLEKGQLTPEEFVVAGDYLVRMSPTWKWMAGEERFVKSYLPPEKQFLVCSGCICRSRVAEVAAAVSETGEEGGWTAAGGPGSSSEEYTDMTESADDAIVSSFVDNSITDVHDGATMIPMVSGDGVRTYDIHIVYDNAYRTPRVYLMGFSHVCGVPLRSEEMLADLMQDYISKTATLEKHPHLTTTVGQFVSIHPCRHAQTMKRLVDEMTVAGGSPTIELYMFIFLKFISSVIPTIEYDLTVAVSVRT